MPELDKKNTQAGLAGGVTVSTRTGTTLCCQNDDLNNQGAEGLGGCHDLQRTLCDGRSLSCSWCDRPQSGRDRRRLRPLSLANQHGVMRCMSGNYSASVN